MQWVKKNIILSCDRGQAMRGLLAALDDLPNVEIPLRKAAIGF